MLTSLNPQSLDTGSLSQAGGGECRSRAGFLWASKELLHGAVRSSNRQENQAPGVYRELGGITGQSLNNPQQLYNNI